MVKIDWCPTTTTTTTTKTTKNSKMQTVYRSTGIISCNDQQDMFILFHIHTFVIDSNWNVMLNIMLYTVTSSSSCGSVNNGTY